VTLGPDVARLARTRPFSLMPREAVQLVAFSCPKHRLKAGDFLFHAGEPGDDGYFVHSGAILLTTKGAAPDSARRVGAGALIGERALYAPVIRWVDARAAEDAVVTPVPRETLRPVLAEFPSAAEKVRASFAERTHRLVDGLDAARVRSLYATARKTGSAS
jgi:CRP/FNR family transcriptional regulator